jgi:CDP-diacylglycerol--glycerol-3-phosphate 3-phosphatidyltransferase
MKKYLPNTLTLLRGILTGIIILLFFFEIPYKFWIIFGFFSLASVTDFFDGYFARKWGVVSDFGIVFDSLFDKILTLSVYILLIPYSILPIWVWLLFLIRELLIDGFKNFYSGKGHLVPAIGLGKWKFFFQVLLLHFCFLFLLFPTSSWHLSVQLIAAITLILAYGSALQYARIFFRLWKS